MRLRVPIVFALALLGVGCLSNVHDRRPFTEGWQHEIEHNKAFQERRAKIDKKDPNALKGDGGAIGHDYDDAKPLLGNRDGASANVDTSGSAVVQYGVRW